jgi:hypothetical protein
MNKLFQVKFTDGSYKQLEASSFAEIEELLGIEVIASIVVLEMRKI